MWLANYEIEGKQVTPSISGRWYFDKRVAPPLHRTIQALYLLKIGKRIRNYSICDSRTYIHFKLHKKANKFA